MYEGPERRKQPCNVECEKVQHLDKAINGNGKPGLGEKMDNVERALYGDPKNGVKGMIAIQADIMGFIKPLKPFLNQKLLAFVFGLSILACLKVLGTDLIMDILKHFFK